MLSRQIARQAVRLSKPTIAPRQALRAPFSTTRCVQALSEAEDPEMVRTTTLAGGKRRLTKGRMVVILILHQSRDNLEILMATGQTNKSAETSVNQYMKMKISWVSSRWKSTTL